MLAYIALSLSLTLYVYTRSKHLAIDNTNDIVGMAFTVVSMTAKL